MEDFEKVTLPTSKGAVDRWVVELRVHREGMKRKQRLIVAVEDPQAPTVGNPWVLLTNTDRQTVSAADAVRIYRWRNWIEGGTGLRAELD